MKACKENFSKPCFHGIITKTYIKQVKSFKIGDLLIKNPIVQGGMGVGISMSSLAAAVANQGGIGTIATVGLGLVHGTPDKNFKQNNIQGLQTEIRKARQNSDGIIAVNIMCVLTNFSDLVETSLEEGIDIIFSGAGLPLDLPKYLKEGQKTKLVPIVSSARAAEIIFRKWQQNFNYLPDAVVVEGPKAGGHLGFAEKDLENESNSLETLSKEILDVINKYDSSIPLIAGGGIYTGADIYDIFQMGVTAVQMGTRFIATDECDADIKFKQALVDADSDTIHVIKSPVGLPGRSIINNFLHEAEEGKRKPEICKYNCIRSCNPKTTSFCIADALHEAFKGNLKDGFAFSGINGNRVNKIVSVKDLFDELICEYDEAEKNN